GFGNGRMAHAKLFGDSAVGFLRVCLEHGGDQIALLLGGNVAAVDVGTDDEGGGASALVIYIVLAGEAHLVDGLHRPTGGEAGAVAIAAIDDLAIVEADILLQSMRLDVGNERTELLALH